jgi:hypothetical protein
VLRPTEGKLVDQREPPVRTPNEELKGACCGWHSIASAARRPFSDRLAAASRHIAIALLSALIVATFSRRCAAVRHWRHRGDARSRGNTRSRGHDPAGLASRIENDYACRGRPGAAAVCARYVQLMREIASWRDVDDV